MTARAALDYALGFLNERTPQSMTRLCAILITVGGAVLLLVLTGAWSSKENAADHRADVDAVNARIQRVLDVVCIDHANAPQCVHQGP